MKRDPLAMAMLAGWLNVSVEQVPERYQVYTCDASMEAWKRVADAARKFLDEEKA